MRYLVAEDADIVVLTETKSVDPGIKEINEMYPVRILSEKLLRLVHKQIRS